jgi:hypothetical protein
LNNEQIAKASAKILSYLEEDVEFKNLNSAEKIAALKSSASVIEFTVQAESMMHIIGSTLRKL